MPSTLGLFFVSLLFLQFSVILHFNAFVQVSISVSRLGTWCIQSDIYEQLAVIGSVHLLRCKVLADCFKSSVSLSIPVM